MKTRRELERAALIRAVASLIYANPTISRDELLTEHVMVDGYNSVMGDVDPEWESAKAEILAHLAEFDANGE